MVFVQQVLSWFGNSVAPQEEEKSNAESNEGEKLETVSPASDLVTPDSIESMEINGYTAPPSNDKNGALANIWPLRVLVSPAANDRRVILPSGGSRAG